MKAFVIAYREKKYLLAKHGDKKMIKIQMSLFIIPPRIWDSKRGSKWDYSSYSSSEST